MNIRLRKNSGLQTEGTNRFGPLCSNTMFTFTYFTYLTYAAYRSVTREPTPSVEYQPGRGGLSHLPVLEQLGVGFLWFCS
jgi:hypothetical protein